MKKVLDLSEHNGNIDFLKVRESGIKDVILRIGWIGNKENHTIDKKFEEYYTKARYYGFNIGIYVYSYCKSVTTIQSGARWVYNKMKNKTFELPIFLDLEDKTIENIGKNVLTSQAIDFCNFFRNKGFESGVYASKYWFINKLEINKLLGYKIWLAEWTSNENHSLGYKVDLWQYTSKGKVSGINTNVDISKCLCECNENNKKGEFEMPKLYKNGSTIERVYSDSLLKFEIGSLNKYEQCECIGIFQNRYIVRYKVNGTNDYKVGFVKYSGGIK